MGKSLTESACEYFYRSETIYGVLRKCSKKNIINFFRNVWVYTAWWLWVNKLVLIPHLLVVAACKGKAPCEEFIGHDSECILISCRNGMSFPLLGSHIVWCTTNNLAFTHG